jgi:hypothetical protein
MPLGAAKAAFLGAAGTVAGGKEWETIAVYEGPTGIGISEMQFTSVSGIDSKYKTLALIVYSGQLGDYASDSYTKLYYSGASDSTSNFNSMLHNFSKSSTLGKWNWNQWEVGTGGGASNYNVQERPGSHTMFFGNWQDSSFQKGALVRGYSYGIGKTSTSSSAASGSSGNTHGSTIRVKPYGSGGYRNGCYFLLAGLPGA